LVPGFWWLFTGQTGRLKGGELCPDLAWRKMSRFPARGVVCAADRCATADTTQDSRSTHLTGVATASGMRWQTEVGVGVAWEPG
jgi:hypothetical protein